MAYKRYPIVEVTFKDPTSWSGWDTVVERRRDDAQDMHACGYLIRKDAKTVSVMQLHTLDSRDRGSEAFAIPRGCVSRIRYVEREGGDTRMAHKRGGVKKGKKGKKGYA